MSSEVLDRSLVLDAAERIGALAQVLARPKILRIAPV